MNEEFVTKEFHDVEIRRIDEKIEAAVSRIEFKNEAFMARMEAAFEEMKAQNASFREHVSSELSDMRSEMRVEIANMRGDMKEMKGEISAIGAAVKNINSSVIWIMTAFGVFISVVSILIQYFK